MKSFKEIDEQLTRAEKISQTNQTREKHLSYEDGVAAALAWVLGDEFEPPVNPTD